MKKVIHLIRTNKIKSTILLVLLIWYYFSLPKPLFNEPTATVIESSEGALLGARIADDGQWRFPYDARVPGKFKQCIVQFEDAYFYRHPGFNPVSIIKALVENIRSGEVKRGGSTLTQQVIRLSRKGKRRTYFEKLRELILATRLELRYSKDKILALYSSNAPFGSNVVGLDMAAWRYFGTKPENLSWAESATLAVLPNAPGLIYPGKNQQELKNKRDKLLNKLLKQKIIDSLTYGLAVQEPLPQRPFALPQTAPHLLQKLVLTRKGQRIRTSIDDHLQGQINQIVKRHYTQLSRNQIFNMAVLVLDVRTRKVLAYVGNSPTDAIHQKDVDVIDKPRSTGSILKPVLYAAMLDAGEILPNTLVADVPTYIAGYNPQNFDLNYSGAVPAGRALSRSLNVPAVRMLQQFGLERFHHYLKKLHLKDISHTADYYGLSIILGGAESNLWDICKTYASFSSTINHFDDTQGKYYTNEIVEPTVIASDSVTFGNLNTEKTIFDAGSLWLTYNSLKEVNRPEGEENWEFFDSSKQIAWKTGTSFGFRDAWAVGTTKDYVVGVWVGNADGEGRPGLVGLSAAAPVLFDVFDLLPRSHWFAKPNDELEKIEVCSKSGYRASEICEHTDTVYVQSAGLKTKPCPYHHWVHLDENEAYQVNSSCYPTDKMRHKSWFVLPPLMEYYYRKSNPDYRTLPQYMQGCVTEEQPVMDFIYPKENIRIFLPKDFDEQTNKLIFKVTHVMKEIKIFWYLDENYLITTQSFHEIAVKPTVGMHTITVVDEFGNELRRQFEITD